MALPKYLQSLLNKLSGVQAEVVESLEEKRNSSLLDKNRAAIVKLCDQLLPRKENGDRVFDQFGSHGVQLEHGNINIIFNRYIRGDCIYVCKDGVTVASWVDQGAAFSGLIGEGDVDISSALTHEDLKPFIEADDPTAFVVKMGCTTMGKTGELGDVLFPEQFKRISNNSSIYSAFPQYGRKRLEEDLSL